MKIRMTALSLALMLILGMTGCRAWAAESMPETAITRERAQQIALEHAGLTADQVQYLRTDFEMDNGRPQFEVEFHQGNWEYDYEIDAETGAILSFDKGD